MNGHPKTEHAAIAAFLDMRSDTEHERQDVDPSVCRLVHYQSYGTPGGEYLPEPRAAIITEVHHVDDGDDIAPDVPDVALCVLNPTGMYFNQRVRYAETPTPGCWNWPPRV